MFTNIYISCTINDPLCLSQSILYILQCSYLVSWWSQRNEVPTLWSKRIHWCLLIGFVESIDIFDHLLLNFLWVKQFGKLCSEKNLESSKYETRREDTRAFLKKAITNFVDSWRTSFIMKNWKRNNRSGFVSNFGRSASAFICRKLTK